MTGILFLLLGLAVIFWWALPANGAVPWTLAVACLAGGAFVVFEGTMGWCAVRALGFKTKM